MRSWQGRGGGGWEGAGAGEGQGPAHQSGAACVLHTLLSGGERGKLLPPIVLGGGCPSPPTSARQSQLSLMDNEQDRTGWEEVRVL